MRPALGLAAICIWIKNGLIFRPGDQRWDKDIVANAAFWDSIDEDNLAEEEELEELIAQGNMIPSTEQRGLYFVSAVEETHGIFHLPWTRSLTAENYALLYNVNSFADLEFQFMQSENKKTRQDVLAGPRRNNKRKRAQQPPRERSPARDIAFRLSEAGVRVAPVAASIPAAVLEGMIAEGHDHPDAELNAVWQDFLRDVVAVIPMAQRGGGSYCTLDVEERERVSEELYKSRELPFRAAILKVAEDSTWDGLFFDRFFPDSVEINRRQRLTQHFGACHYWTRWQVLMAKVIDRGQQITIRGKLRSEFRKLMWLPWTSSDRIWVTGRTEKGTFVKLPEGHEGPAPKIAINGRLGTALSLWSLKGQGQGN
ncbi:hypothetical protein PsYK624_160510 [Phanerochaete sordida]|uniref:Uncharacterized protein n=1 Tax=Phanerochaete sordida TaxID=48140 RepID=A0A9P3GUE9_9APHY|nr:hypothetical protein PsYK624_160510 [Phanerochaete sordida]